MRKVKATTVNVGDWYSNDLRFGNPNRISGVVRRIIIDNRAFRKFVIADTQSNTEKTVTVPNDERVHWERGF